MVSEVLVGTPVIAASEMRTHVAGANIVGTKLITRKVDRVTGVRSMSPVFLQRLGKYLGEKGFSDAVPEVLGWLEPKRHKAMDSNAHMNLLARLEASRPYVSPREVAYLDAAIFCVTAWPPATGS